MSGTAARMAARGTPVWLTQGFRPFFLAAALWAVAALTVWVVLYAGGGTLPSRFDPLAWHIHEMLFGFVMAAVGGFLLTAVPNWTGRPPAPAPLLAGLAGLWLAGRIACLVSQTLPVWLAIAADLSFPLALIALCAREVFPGGKSRNLAPLAPVSVLTIGNLLMHLEAAGYAIPPGLGWRIGFGAILALVALIGGRIIPAFTQNWLNKRGTLRTPIARGPVDAAALGTLAVALLAWAFLPQSPVAGWLLVAAALCNGWRLLRWRGLSTREEPLLLVLHLGYGWLAAGLLFLGLTGLHSALPESAGIHALTVGAIGTMILAVMTRVTRGHSGRALAADRATVLIYGLVSAAALTRVAAALFAGAVLPLVIVSACFWVAAFGTFVLCYGRALLRPRIG